MDRDLMLALMGAVFGTILISAYYFGGTPSGDATAGEAGISETSSFAPNDVRYPFEQEEKKARAKAAKKKHAPPPPPSDSGNDYADESSGDSDVEQPPAEEPDIE